jgi:ATP-dependent Clp protease ATP-binding subunit ClpA
MDTFTADAREALRRAHTEARNQSHEQLDQLHLLLGLAQDGRSAAGRALRSLSITSDQIRAAMEVKLPRGESPPARRLGRNQQAKRAMRLAARLALRQSEGNPLAPVGSDQLLMGIFLARRGLGHELLAEQNISRQHLRDALAAAKSHNDKGESSWIVRKSNRS